MAMMTTSGTGSRGRSSGHEEHEKQEQEPQQLRRRSGSAERSGSEIDGTRGGGGSIRKEKGGPSRGVEAQGRWR